MTQSPNTPDYAAPLPPLRPKDPHPFRSMLIGLGIGAALSASVWIGLWSVTDQTPVLLIIIPLVKIGAAIAMIVASVRTRFAGIGLLISIPLGALIFMGACLGHLNMH
jgi:hypothetical protein